MTLDYIEQMAKEYNELLKTVKLPKAHSIKIPESSSEKVGKVAKNKRQQLSAVEYLMQCSVSKTKTMLLEVLRDELFSGAASAEGVAARKFRSAEAAFSFLIKKQAENLKETADFQTSSEDYMRETRITAVLSILAN